MTHFTEGERMIATAQRTKTIPALVADALAAAHATHPEYRAAEARLNDLHEELRGLESRRASLSEESPRWDRDELDRDFRRKRDEIAEQSLAVERGHAAWSDAVCSRLAPLHGEIMRRMAWHLRGGDAAGEDERALREAINDSGAHNRLRPMPVPMLGRLSDDTSLISLWFADAIEHNLLDKEEGSR